MKKAMLLASLAALTISGGAMAMTEDGARAISIAGAPAGFFAAFFTTNIDGPAGSCEYYVDWQSPFAPAGSVACTIRELKSLGHTSCLTNRLFNFQSIVTSVANQCLGFDQFGIPQPVTVVLGESNVAPTLNGLAVFPLFSFLPRPMSVQ